MKFFTYTPQKKPCFPPLKFQITYTPHPPPSSSITHEYLGVKSDLPPSLCPPYTLLGGLTNPVYDTHFPKWTSSFQIPPLTATEPLPSSQPARRYCRQVPAPQNSMVLYYRGGSPNGHRLKMRLRLFYSLEGSPSARKDKERSQTHF